MPSFPFCLSVLYLVQCCGRGGKFQFMCSSLKLTVIIPEVRFKQLQICFQVKIIGATVRINSDMYAPDQGQSQRNEDQFSCKVLQLSDLTSSSFGCICREYWIWRLSRQHCQVVMKKAEPDIHKYITRIPLQCHRKEYPQMKILQNLYIFVTFYVFSLLETYLMEIEFQSHHFNFLELI